MDDSKLRAYLLGQLSGTEAERLEERALQDEEVFQTLRSVEDDLFDEYARNTLNPTDRERFLERYGGQKDRLTFAHALAAPAASRGVQRAKAAVIPFPARRWVAGLAAAAVVVLAVSAIVVRDETPAGTPSVDQPAVPPDARAPAPPLMVSLTLGTTRSASGAARVTVPKDAAALELRVRLDPADRFDRYAIDLRSPADNIVWGDAAPRVSREGGELTLAASVPASSLSDGSYELAVRGGAANAPLEDLGFVTLEVRRTP